MPPFWTRSVYTLAIVAWLVGVTGAFLQPVPVRAQEVALTVQDFDSSRAIASASVRIVGAPAEGARVVSLGEGAFGISAPSGTLLAVDVSAPGYATATVGIVTSAEEPSRIRLSRISPEISRWLRQVNADRATAGAPPIVLDETLIEAARAHAGEMAVRGYISHYDTRGFSPSDRCALAGAQMCSENLAWGHPDALSAEAAFFGERTQCAQSCPPSAGHYVNLISRADIAGLAITTGALHDHGIGAPVGRFYDQEFAQRVGAVREGGSQSTATVGTPISIRFRVLDGHRATFANWFHTTCAPATFTTAALHASEPYSPYPSNCSSTTPTARGLALIADRHDPNVVTVRGTPDTPGVWYLGLADGSDFLAVAVVRVN